MKKFLTALMAVFLAVMITACGGGHSPTTLSQTTSTPSVTTVTPSGQTQTVPLTQACPPGRATMGCASGAPGTFTLKPPAKAQLGLTAPVGDKFPDVSNFQGCSLSWSAIQASGAIFKLGEGTSYVDVCAGHNHAGLIAAHKQWGVYWFVRPVGSLAEAQKITATLRAYGITVSHVVIYTGGTWAGGPSGGLDTWVAAYGSYTAHPDVPYTTRYVGWQYTDGHYGPVTYIKGLGYGDTSVSYGIFRWSAHLLVLDEEVPGIQGYAGPIAQYVLAHDGTPKPRPRPLVTCKPFKSQKTAAACHGLRKRGAVIDSKIAAERRTLKKHGCYVHHNLKSKKQHWSCPAELTAGKKLHAQRARLLAS